MKIKKIIILLTLVGLIACQQTHETESSPEITTIENSLLKAIQVSGDEPELMNIYDRMEFYKVPGVSIAVVKNGQLAWAKGYGLANTNIGAKIDKNTIFQAGSISKPLAALAALRLVEEGKLELDKDVNTYLQDWKIAENRFTEIEKITLRRLLTHTAGMTVHGFPGYQQTDSFPSITKVLNGEGNTDVILPDTIPGSIWRYSGGGYTVMEKVVEDASGMPLEKYMDEFILQPMGMHRSTYNQPLTNEFYSNASAAYDREGKIIEGLWHNYPEQAAAGLWTTPTDLATYCMEIQKIFKDHKEGVLSQDIVKQMLTKHKNGWGLGPSLMWEKDSLIFGHGGKNAGFTNDMKAFAHKGDAVIIMTNADNGGKLIAEIMRSISAYYNWGISKPRTVELKTVSKEELSELTGQYKLDFQVPDIGDYIIDLSVEGDKIFVNDPNNKDTNLLSSMGELKFIDLEKGDEVQFKISENDASIELLWNNRYNFIKQIE